MCGKGGACKFGSRIGTGFRIGRKQCVGTMVVVQSGVVFLLLLFAGRTVTVLRRGRALFVCVWSEARKENGPRQQGKRERESRQCE